VEGTKKKKRKEEAEKEEKRIIRKSTKNWKEIRW